MHLIQPRLKTEQCTILAQKKKSHLENSTVRRWGRGEGATLTLLQFYSLTVLQFYSFTALSCLVSGEHGGNRLSWRLVLAPVHVSYVHRAPQYLQPRPNAFPPLTHFTEPITPPPYIFFFQFPLKPSSKHSLPVYGWSVPDPLIGGQGGMSG